MPATHAYCLGLDLGKQTDFSALAVLRWPLSPAPRRPVAGAPPVPPPSRRERIYEVPVLKRWPLGVAYLDIAAQLARFLAGPDFTEAHPVVAVDATGVGDAVYEMLHREMTQAGIQGSALAVTITAGSAVTHDQGAPGRWRVAKKQLVSVMQVLLGQRRLHIAEALPEARTLQRELGTFSVKITDSANETFESWRERDHDDLVLATCLAAWAAETLDIFRGPSPPLRPLRLTT